MDATQLLIIAAVFVVAVLYSSVGHGGASGYLAVMAFLAVAPAVTRPTALILNIFVSSIAAFQFYRRGYFDRRVFFSFAAASIPFAFIGGMIDLPAPVYKKILGAVLLFAALRLAWNFTLRSKTAAPKVWIALTVGAAIGLVSGLIGVGGGIFLTPILLLMNWTEARTAAGVSAVFILVNSIAGLLGNSAQVMQLTAGVAVWVIAAVSGGIVGAGLGSRRFDSITLRRVLAVVLVIAGGKLMFA